MDLLVELALSWLIIRLAQKKGLGVLGMRPNRTRILQLLSGFFGACLLCGFNFFLQTRFSGSHWLWNKALTLPSTLDSVWWVLHSVLYEELIFRGALLYGAIQKVGLKKACLLSAIAFGIYHWFSMNAFGQWIQMGYLFVATGVMGYQFALAYARTQSLYLPIGLHLGWNLINTFVFSQGPLGNQLLILQAGERFSLIENTIVLLVSTFALPLMTFLYLKWMENKGVDQLISKA
jgi:membrane protease YdiL (CAAX protease family)